MAAKFYIGERLSFSGALCTVRYIGTVKGTKGEWLGVEWDDPTRGKHAGEHGGVKYFECRRKATTAGSFVRPTRPVDPPVGFLEALHNKYASGNSKSTGLNSHGGSSEKPIEISGKVVEEVGFEKIRQQLARLYELQIILLDGLCIAGVLPDATAQQKARWFIELDRIEETCPKITDLDLSRNLIETWAEVEGVCIALPKLKSLRINGNRFKENGLPEDVGSRIRLPRSPYQGITELGLDDTLLAWEEVIAVAGHFSSLTSLSASYNDLSRLSSPLCSDTLASLTLERNAFQSLSSLSPLTNLPNLKSLFLRDNVINIVQDRDDTASNVSRTCELRFSKSLNYVDLSYNAIWTWSFIDDLQNVLPGLTGLRISHNPLYEKPAANDGKVMSVDEGYMLTLARLGALKILNFSNISKQERTNGEMYYLSRIAKAMADVPEAEETKITSQHPRFAELCEIYGAPTVTRKAPTAVDPNSIAARLITFTFYFSPPTSEHASAEPVTRTKRIPRAFDIYRLKGIVGRLFGQKPMSLKLTWETGELDPVAGYEEEWDSSDEEEVDDAEAGNDDQLDKRREDAMSADEMVMTGKWVRREVELMDSTREVGFWIDGKEARVRVELRQR